MDFLLNEEEHSFQESLREFLKGEIAPMVDVAFIGVDDAQTGTETFLLAERGVSS